MKVFKKSALVLAMTASAGMAHAASSEIDVTASINLTTPTAFSVDSLADIVGDATTPNQAGAVSVEQRVVESGAITIDSDSADLDGARSVVYEPAVALASALTLQFDISGGALVANNDLALIAFDDGIRGAGPDGTTGETDDVPASYVQVGSVNDFVAGNDGWTSVIMQLDLSDANAANASFLNADGQIKEGTAIALVDNTANANPDFNMNQGASEVSIVMSKATNSSGVNLAAPVSNSELLAKAESNIDLAVNTVTSTIDVEFQDPVTNDLNSRRGFAGHNADSAGVGGGVGSISGTNSEFVSSANAQLDLGTAEVTIASTVTGSELSVSRGNVDGVVGVGIDTVTPTDTLFQDTLANGAYTIDYGTNLAALVTGQEIAILVNGDDVLATGNWTAQLSVTPASITAATFVDPTAGVAPFTLTETSHVWDINGAQVKIPYHAQETSGFFFFTKVVNESGRDAEVFADVIVEKDPNSANPTSVVVQDVALGSVPANGSVTINQNVIKAAINDAEPGTIVEGEVAHVAMTMTVLAPTDQVQVSAYQKDASGRTDLPVYFDTTSRNWLQ